MCSVVSALLIGTGGRFDTPEICKILKFLQQAPPFLLATRVTASVAAVLLIPQNRRECTKGRMMRCCWRLAGPWEFRLVEREKPKKKHEGPRLAKVANSLSTTPSRTVSGAWTMHTPRSLTPSTVCSSRIPPQRGRNAQTD